MLRLKKCLVPVTWVIRFPLKSTNSWFTKKVHCVRHVMATRKKHPAVASFISSREKNIHRKSLQHLNRAAASNILSNRKKIIQPSVELQCSTGVTRFTGK